MAVGQRAYKMAQEKLDAYIHENGKRFSPVRNMILEQVCALPQPFTAEQLQEACAGERISQASIYNALQLFLKLHIISATKRQQGQSVTEYELTTVNTIRMQQLCCRCGRVTEIRDQAITRLLRERAYQNFKMQRFTLLVYGECRKCRKSETDKKKK